MERRFQQGSPRSTPGESENDLAFEWLERAFAIHDGGLSYLLGNIAFARLVDDPRWPAFLQRLGLLEAWKAMPPEYGGPRVAEG